MLCFVIVYEGASGAAITSEMTETVLCSIKLTKVVLVQYSLLCYMVCSDACILINSYVFATRVAC